MNLIEVLDHGPIVFADTESGQLITINGSYLNLWQPRRDGEFDCIECASGHPSLYKLTVAQAMDLAKEWFDEMTNPDDDEEEEEEE